MLKRKKISKDADILLSVKGHERGHERGHDARKVPLISCRFVTHWCPRARALKVRNIQPLVDLKLNLFRMEASATIMSNLPQLPPGFKLVRETRRQRNQLVKSIKILLVGAGIWEKWGRSARDASELLI